MQKIELKKIKANEIFSPLIKKFDRIEKVPHYKDEIWSNDLIDSSSLSEYNIKFKFIFTIFDNYAKYACANPPKDDKSGESTTKAFKKLKSKRNPQKVWSDRGK